MAWASSGGYPGITSTGIGSLRVPSTLSANILALAQFGELFMLSSVGGNLIDVGEGRNNDGLAVQKGVGLFGHAPPAAATAGGAHTAGGTYTAVEQGMLEAAYAALRSIGLVT